MARSAANGQAERGGRLLPWRADKDSCDTTDGGFGAYMTSPIGLLFDIVWVVILAHVIVSWLINFQVLNLRQPQVAQVWGLLNRMVEPIYRPIRRMLPPMGGLDLAPLIAIIILIVLRDVLTRYTGLM
jgi:YggT family protein